MSRWERHDDRSGEPRPGVFTIKLCRGGPDVPAEIVLGEQGWQATIDGIAYPPHPDAALAPAVYRVWHSAQHTDVATHAYLVAIKLWAAAYQSDHPALHPYQPVDIAALAPVIP